MNKIQSNTIHLIGSLNASYSNETSRTNYKIKNNLATLNSNKGFKSFNHIFTVNLPYINKKLNETSLMLDDVSVAIKNNKLYGIDIETLGDVNDNIFNITEISLLQRQITKDGVKDVVNTYVFGIDNKQYSEYVELIMKAEHMDFNELTQSEKSTLQRLAMYSGEFKERFVFDKKTKRYVLKNLNANANIYDIKTIKEGLKNLNELYNKSGQALNSKKGIDMLKEIHNTLNAIDANRDFLITYNGKNFDLPRINKAFELAGLKSININRHYDVYDTIKNVFENNLLEFQNTIGNIENLKNIDSVGKLEAFGKLLGVEYNAHEAQSDIKFTMDIGINKLNNTNKTLIEIVKDKITNTMEKYNGIEGLSVGVNNNVLYINNAIGGNLNSITYVNGEYKPYLTYPLRRSNFYYIDDISVLDKENIQNTLELSDDLKNSNQIYKIRFKNASDELDEVSEIFLNEEQFNNFNDLLNKNTTAYKIVDNIENPYEITKEQINNVTRQYKNDLIRRKYEDLFNPNGKGFEQIEKIYNTYNNINEYFETNITQNDIENLIKNKHLTIGKKTLTYDEAFKLFDNGYGINKEQVETFGKLFNLIEQSNTTSTAIINEINKVYSSNNTNLSKDLINYHKTLDFKLAFEKIEQDLYSHLENDFIKESLENDPEFVLTNKHKEHVEDLVKQRKIKPINIDDIDYIDIIDNNKEYVRLSLNNQEYTKQKLFSILKKINDDKKIKSETNKIRHEYLQNVISDLQFRGIISSDFNKYIDNTKDVFHTANLLVEELYKTHNTIKNNLSVNQLLNAKDIIKTIDMSDDNYNLLFKFKNYHMKDVKTLYLPGYITSSIDNYFNEIIKDNPGYISSYIKNNNSKMLINLTPEMINKKGFNKKLPEQFETILKAYNYEDEHIKLLNRALFNENYGYITKYNLAAFLYEEIDDAGNNVLKIGFTKQEHYKKAIEEIKTNGITSNAAVIELPKIINREGIKSFKLGMVEKANISKLNVYVDNRDYNLPLTERFKITEVDTMTEALDSLIKVHPQLEDYLKDNDYERLSKKINKVMNEPVISGINYTGLQAWEDQYTGNITKKVVYNIQDYLTSKALVDASESINIVPILYQHDKEIKKELDNIITSIGKDPEKYINDWLMNLSERYPYGDLKELDFLDYEIREWYQKNAILGRGLLSRFKDISTDEKTKETLELLLNKNVSQLIKEGKVVEGFISKDNPIEYITYGAFMNPGRPVMNQSNAFLAINLDNINDETVNSLKQHNIKIGESVVTTKVTEYLDTMHDIGYRMTTGVTTDVKMISTSEILNKLESIENNKQNILNKFGDKYNEKDLEEVINFFYTYADTNQQHSLVKNVLKEKVFNENELISFKANEKIINNLKEGQRLEKGQLLGIIDINNENIEFKYDKENGVITHIEGDTIFVKPEKPSFDEIKISVGNNEKSAASIARIQNKEHLQELIDSVYEEIAGSKDVTVMHFFEIGKHETASLPFGNYINLISEKAIESGQKEMERFEELMAKYMPYMNFKYTIDKHTGNYIGTISGQINQDNIKLFDDIEQLMNEYRNSQDEFSNEIIKTINFYEENKIHRTHVRRMILSETLTSQADADDMGKGIKVNHRMEQVFGLYLGEGDDINFRKINKDKYEKIVKPIIDYEMNLIKQTPEYKKGQRLIKNLVTSMEVIYGSDNITGNVKHINLSDIDIPSNNMTIEEFEETLFKNFNKHIDENGKYINAYVIKLPNNMKVFNRVKQVEEDHIIMPALNSLYVRSENKMYMSEMQKEYASLINDLKRLEEYKTNGKSLKDFVENINTKYNNIITNVFEHEFNNKNGIVNKLLLSGRIPYSGYQLAVGVVSPVYEIEGKELSKEELENALKNNDSRLNLKNKVTGKDVVKFENNKLKIYDIVEVSDDTIKELGVNYRDIGEQLTKEGFWQNKEFIKSLKEKQIIDDNLNVILNYEKPPMPELPEILKINKNYRYNQKTRSELEEMRRESIRERQRILKNYNKQIKEIEKQKLNEIYEQIGEIWANKVGIAGTFLRHPTFLQTSRVAALVRVNPSLQGKAVIAQAHTAKKLNLDVDTDKPGITLFLEKIKGRTVMKNADSNVYQAWNEQYELQAEHNKKWVLGGYDDYNPTKNGVATLEEYKAKVIDIRGEEFLNNINYASDDIVGAAIKARHDKGAIGYVNIPNYIVRDIAMSTMSNSLSDLELQRHIYDLTDLTEQKLIDSKHNKFFLETVSSSPTYKRALHTMGQGKEENIKQGLDMMINTLKNANLLDKDLDITADDIFEGNFDKDNSILKGLYGLKEMFSKDEAINIWNNKLIKNQSNITSIGIYKEIFNLDDLPNSEILQMKKDEILSAINLSNDVVKDYFENTVFVSKGNLLPHGIYRIDKADYNMHSGQSYINFVNLETEESVNLYGDNIQDIFNNVKNNFNLSTIDENISSLSEKQIDKLVKENISHEAGKRISNSFNTAENALLTKAKVDAVNMLINGEEDIDSVVNTVLENNKINISDKDYFSDQIKGIYNNLNDTEKEIYKKMGNFYSRNKNAELINFAREIAILKQENLISEDTSLIKEYNMKILHEGLEKAKENKFDLVNNYSNVIITPGIQNNLNQIENINVSIATQNVDEIIQNIEKTKVYDVNQAHKELLANFKDKIKSLQISNADILKDENLMKNLIKEGFDKNINKIINENKTNIESLNKYYADLISTNANSAYEYLGWDKLNEITNKNKLDVSDINVLENMKIGHGQYVGKKLGELGINELNEIMNYTAESNMKPEQIEALYKTQGIVNTYLNALNENNDYYSKAVNRKIKYDVYNTDNMINIEDLNNMIKEKAKETENTINKQKIIKEIEDTVDDSIWNKINKHLPEGKGTKALIVGGLALGVASMLAGDIFTKTPSLLTPERKPTGDSPNLDGSYDEQPKVTQKNIAPPTEKTIRVTEPSGAKIKVRGIADTSDNSGIISTIKNAILQHYNRANISISSKEEKPSDNWLSNAISNILN